MLALGQAAGRGHEQCKAEVGRGLGQHIGRIGALHASGGHGVHIKVVVAHGHVGADFEARRSSQQRGIHALAAGGQHSIFVSQARSQLLLRPDHVVGIGFHVEVLAQTVHDVREDRTGDQDAGFAHIQSPGHRNQMNVITIKSGTRMPPDHSM